MFYFDTFVMLSVYWFYFHFLDEVLLIIAIINIGLYFLKLKESLDDFLLQFTLVVLYTSAKIDANLLKVEIWFQTSFTPCEHWPWPPCSRMVG